MIAASLRGLLARHAVVQAVTQAVALATGLVMSAVLSRHLGVDGFGSFTYLFAFIYFFLALSDLGVQTIVVREISQQPGRSGEIVGAMVSFRVIVALVALMASWAVIVRMAFPPDLARSLALFSLMLPLGALKLPVAVFQARLKIEYGAAIDVITRVVGLALVMLVVWLGKGLVAIAAALVANDLASVILIWIVSRRLVRVVWRVDRACWARVLQASLPLGLAGLLVALTNRVDFLMLERMVGLEPVGLYGAAYRITGVLERLPQLVMITLYPIMARAALDDVRGLRLLYHRTLAVFAVLAIMVVAVIHWLGPWLLGQLFGREFEPADPGLQVLVWSTAFLYVAIAGGHLLISAGWQRVSLGAWLAGTGLNIGLNLLWIPRWGFVGAAMATACTYAVILAVTLVSAELAMRHLAARRSVEPVGGGAAEDLPSPVVGDA